jgi:cytochrome c oxidase assembly protein subunit 15
VVRSPEMFAHRGLARAAWATLAVTVAVAVWGAFVRATGSGAGCGSHWPLCDGAVVPVVGSAATAIEFTHRITSGLALLAVVGLWAALRRMAPAGALARRAALVSLVFMLIEAGIGAGLVLLELVGENTSVARAVVMGAHLINTFALVAALTITAWALGGRGRLRLAGGPPAGVLWGCAVALLLTGVSGAIAALGDTLFPADSLFEAWHQELSVTSNVLIRLRLLHPVIAVLAAAAVALVARAGTATDDSRLARALLGLLGVQLAAGAINVLLLAPIWLQLVHLLLANAVWIVFVLLAASRLSRIPA